MGTIAERATLTFTVGPVRVRAEANGTRPVGTERQLTEFALNMSILAGLSF